MPDEGYGITLDSGRRLSAMLAWFENFPRNGMPETRRKYPVGGGVTMRRGKAAQNIPMRTSGKVEIWTGTPGSETEIDPDPTPYVFNDWSATVTKGCWVDIVGPVIVNAINPARIIRATLTADLPAGGSSADPTVDSFFDGHDPSDTDVIPTLKIWADNTQGETVVSGSKIKAMWDDVEQKYFSFDWTC